jgi:UDP-N-acetylglucosamine--dolichyl-phosphate N-acetylglucosaminephosphotransferase
MKRRGYVGYDIHKNARPKIAESGGISIILGFSAACLLMLIFFPLIAKEILVYLLTVVLAGFIGYIDDRKKLKSRTKILLSILTGVIIFIANFVGFINISSPNIPFLGQTRLTIIYLIAVPIIVAVFANTVNMLEGYNGEGSGTCLIAVIFILICGLIYNSAEAVLFTIIATSVLIPFFIYNKYPAKIFPGDVGTLSIGTMIACIALFGSIEIAVFCAMLIHIFNSFYVISSVRGFFESSVIQKDKNDIILLDDDRIKASNQKNAVLTLPRLILAKGPLSEPELVKQFYVISIICGFFAIVATLFLRFSSGSLDLLYLLLFSITLIFLTSIFLYKFPRIRGIIIQMIVLLIAGSIFMIFVDLVIMPYSDENYPFPPLNIFGIVIPYNILIPFIIATPGFLLWYYITIRYFWYQIDKIKPNKNNK